MRTHEELVHAYQAEDSERMLREPMFTPDWLRIRRALKHAEPSAIVQMRCYNEADRDAIKAALTPEELSRVRFTWLVWPAIRSKQRATSDLGASAGHRTAPSMAENEVEP